MERANPIWLWHSPCSGYAPHAGQGAAVRGGAGPCRARVAAQPEDAAKAAYLVKLRDKYGVTVDDRIEALVKSCGDRGSMTASSRFLLTFCCALLLVHFGSAIASAHEVRPAYLELTERGPFVFDMLLKTPMRGDARLALGATLTGRTGLLQPVSSHASDDAMVQTWRIGLIGGSIAGRELRIEGLERTMTDALVRIEFTDGTTWTDRLTPDRPSVRVPLRPTGWEVAQTYLLLGIEHILLGTDHLLFVLGLILIAQA